MNTFDNDCDSCPDGYQYYYVECMDLVGRIPGDRILESEIFQPEVGWIRDVTHEISDRIVGFDPYEDPGWMLGNTEIMDEIRCISRDEAIQRIEKLRL